MACDPFPWPTMIDSDDSLAPPPPPPSLSQDLNQVLLEVADLTRRPERRPVPPGGTPVPIVTLMTACWETFVPPAPARSPLARPPPCCHVPVFTPPPPPHPLPPALVVVA